MTFKRISDLEIGKRYLWIDIDRIFTHYGQRDLVKCGGIKFTLPESWTDTMSPNNIKTLLQYDKPLKEVYNGKIQLPNDKTKHYILFTRD